MNFEKNYDKHIYKLEKKFIKCEIILRKGADFASFRLDNKTVFSISEEKFYI